MSEIRVDTITEKTSGSGTTVSNLKNPNSPFRNKIINGDMSIAQRATSATTVGNSTYTTLDRIVTQHSSDGAWTGEQHAMSLAEINTTGQSFAYEANCTTADGTIGAAQYALVSQRIEGQFLQDLRYGTSNAKTITVSFWCKSNLTGTFSLYLYKLDTTGYYIPNEFSISSADTWEYKTVTITPTAGSTSLITSSGGVIDNNNGASLEVGIVLAMGSNYQGTNNTWTSSSHYTTSNQANFLSSTDNNFSFTGFQLEVGSTATDFEHLPHDVQLHRCRRYCQSWDYSSQTGPFAPGRTLSSNRVDSFFSCHPPMRDAVSAISDSLTVTSYYYDGGQYQSLTQTGTSLVHAVNGGTGFAVRKTFSDTLTASKMALSQFGGTLIATCEL